MAKPERKPPTNLRAVASEASSAAEKSRAETVRKRQYPQQPYSRVSLRQVREQMARRARGDLTPEEEASLMQDARILRRRLERLKALDPERFAGVELHAELDELAQPPVLTGSS